MKTCSIIIPTRDRPLKLLRAVGSALAALPEDSEVVVVDDASERPAAQTLLQIPDPRIKVLRNDHPLGGGGSPSRNKGVEAAGGLTLFFLDDDDELVEEYCRQILNSHTAQQNQFGFSARLFRSNSDHSKPTNVVEKRKLPSGIISPKSGFKHRTFPFSSGFWLTRDAYLKAGPFAETLSTNSDTEYCLRMYDAGLKGFYSDSPGVVIYENEGNASAELANVTTRSKSSDRSKAFEAIAQKHTRYLAANQDAADFVYVRWVKHALRAGEKVSVEAAISQAPNLFLRLKLQLLKNGYALTGRRRSK